MTSSVEKSLDLVAQYSASNDLLLEATVAILSDFADLLEDESRGSDHRLLIPMEPVAKSYGGFLATLHLVKDQGALKIYRERSALVISGSPENCSTLAANIRFLCGEALSQPSMLPVLHAHIEYFPSHPYLASVSDPVVIYIKSA